MTRPTLGAGLARVHLYDRSLTSLGTITPPDLTWTHSKEIDGSSISFSVSALDPLMVSNPDVLEDSYAIVELDVAGVWTPVGTPYVLAPGTGTMIGTAEGAAYEFQPSGVGAAAGLGNEMLVLPSYAGILRRSPTERYIGWQSELFNATSWPSATVVDPAGLAITAPKFGQPNGWPAAAASAKWVYRDPASGDTGGLTLFRFGSFTVSTQRKYRIGFSCDEECKVYLDGDGYGGVFGSSSDQETGYTNYNFESEVLKPGTYYVAAEMTTINSAGGDGFDAIRLFVGPVDEKNHVSSTVLTSGSGTKVYRQSKTAVRPGFTADVVLDKLRDENSDWNIWSADILTVVPVGTMPAGEERVWPVGTTLAQVIADLSVDVHIDVDTSWHMNVAANPGTDLSATIGMTPGAATPTSGMNVEGAGWSSDPVAGSRALVLTNDGFVEVVNDALEVAPIGGRGMYLESGASGSIAKGVAYAMDAIAQGGKIRRNYHVDAAAVTGKVPFVHYNVCDVISGLNHKKVAEKQQVLSITGTNQATRASFTLELGPVTSTVPSSATLPSTTTVPGG